MPPICVLSKARCTSATKAPIVTSASRSATPTVSAGATASPDLSASRPIVASANSE